jgi:hypothetical protein
VVLTATFTPVCGQDGELDACEVQFQIKDSTPKRESKVYSGQLTAGGLVLNDLSPEDARQVTIDEIGPRKAVGS